MGESMKVVVSLMLKDMMKLTSCVCCTVDPRPLQATALRL